MWMGGFIPQIIVSLVLAAWLTNTIVKVKGAGAIKILTYMPNIITAASVSVLFNALFAQYGPITLFLKKIGVLASDFNFMYSVGGARGIISFILFWMWYGNTTLLLISGMMGINPSLAVMIVPGTISAIGFYRFMLKLNLLDTYWPLIVPSVAAPAIVFFMKQYMESTLSKELVEAARIDGSGEFHTFNVIAIPLMKPAVATQAIFAFVASWNNLFMPNMIITSDVKKTLPLFVVYFNLRLTHPIAQLFFLRMVPLFIHHQVLALYLEPMRERGIL